MIHYFGSCLADDGAVTQNQPPPDAAEPIADLTLQDPTGEPLGKYLIHTLLIFYYKLLSA